jgi:hypothetical protein
MYFASLHSFLSGGKKTPGTDEKTKNTTDAMLSPSKTRRAIAALCFLLSLALLGASVASASSSSSSSGQCACSDVRPRTGGIDFELGPTCAEIQAKGSCNEGYMQRTIAEMKGAPYCQVWARKRKGKKERGKKDREREFEHGSRSLSLGSF